MEGTPFGRYRLIELIGEGGMGEVWRAHDTDTDRIVAIKVLPAHFSDNEDFKQRFRREAHAAARLNTPHVIPIHNYGEIDGRLYVDMRLIEGSDLQAVLADGPIEPARAARIIGQVAVALHAAHKVGLLHRDVKPSNVLLDENDFAYLIDFGIARAADETRLTKSGNTIGTFQYIAPERLGTGTEDARADIYSLACVLYECLTGHPPFDEASMAQLVAAHLSTPPPKPSTTQPNVPAQIDPVIATGMAKDPEQRYATTIELADAARDAITVPIPRPTTSPTQPATEPAHNLVTAQPSTVKAEPLVHAMPAPPRPASPIPTRAGGISRRATIALIAGAVALVAVIAAVIGISAVGKHGPSESAPTSSSSPTSSPSSTSSSPTSSKRSYAAQSVLPFTGLHFGGVAVDSAGAVYVTDYEGASTGRVLKLAAGSATQSVLPFTGLNAPQNVAADTAGNVYVTDARSNRVLKLPAGSSSQEVLPFTGLSTPSGVAVDTAGDLYVTDRDNNRVVKMAAGSSTLTELPFTGLSQPEDVAVDAADNLYVTDYQHNRVLKLAAGSSAQVVLPFTGLSGPNGVAVDSAGNVYVAELFNKRVLELAAGSSTQVVLPFTGLNGASGVAVDSAGNVYVEDHDPRGTGDSRVLKLPVQ